MRNGMIGWMVAAAALSLAASAGPANAAPSPVPAPGQGCGEAPAGVVAAAYNTLTLDTLDVDLFGRPEHGWRIYAPRIGVDLGTTCIPESPRFALALAGWQSVHGLFADGVMHVETLTALKAGWQAARPFMALRAADICPAPPPETAILTAPEADTAGGANPAHPPRLRADALAALERLRAAAKAESPEAARNPELLGLFSGFRSPAYDAARCARDGDCTGVTRASCSAHRTGAAMDLFVGALPGYSADSSTDENRLYQTQSEAYAWLLALAPRFGFVNYVFEPWHWEYVGAPAPGPAPS